MSPIPFWVREMLQRVNMERRLRLGATIVSIMNEDTGEPMDIDDLDDDLLEIIEDQNAPKFGDALFIYQDDEDDE